MIKKIVLTVFFSILLAIGGIFLYNNFKPVPEKLHYHAGFQVYRDDKLQDFSGVQYITVSPCTDRKGHEEKDKQLEKGHLHDQVGDVVHVEAKNSTWSDLFRNLKFLTGGKVVAYFDGLKIENPLVLQIKSYQSAVFYFGKHDPNFKPDKKSVTVNHIKEVEKTSVECGD